MATITPKQLQDNNGSQYVLWEAVTHSDGGGNAKISTDYPDKTIIAFGTFGGGYDRTLQGSADGTTFVTCTNPLGTPITFTANAHFVIAQNLPYYKILSATAGTASDVDFYLYFSK